MDDITHGLIGKTMASNLSDDIGASIGQSATSDEKWSTARDEFLKAVAEKCGAVFFEEILSHTPGASARASALINLSGGWDAFVNRVKIDLLGIKP